MEPLVKIRVLKDCLRGTQAVKAGDVLEVSARVARKAIEDGYAQVEITLPDESKIQEIGWE